MLLSESAHLPLELAPITSVLPFVLPLNTLAVLFTCRATVLGLNRFLSPPQEATNPMALLLRTVRRMLRNFLGEMMETSPPSTLSIPVTLVGTSLRLVRMVMLTAHLMSHPELSAVEELPPSEQSVPTSLCV